MDYLSVEEARERPGLRLVLTTGVPGPWGEAIKSVLAFKQLDYLPTAQEAGGENKALVDWSGQASAPVLAWNKEPPRISWLSQLELAERLAPDKPLLGETPYKRAEVVGLCHVIAGQDGIGWQRRHQLTGLVISRGEAPPYMQRMANRYDYSEAAFAACEHRLIELLGWFRGCLASRRDNDSDYLVGNELTAADLYLANFMGMFDPLPENLNPMSEQMRRAYSYRTEGLAKALDPLLLAHRDLVVQRHITTPLDF